MSAPLNARERVRAEITAEILRSAKRQLSDAGPAALSLRAVARELGMASSAVYRYFRNRDELITALLLDAYDELGAVAECAAADPDPATPRTPLESWLAIWRAVREWTLEHRHEFALLFGTPVPGYVAPEATAAAAARAPLALAGVAGKAVPLSPGLRPHFEDELIDPGARELTAGLEPQARVAVLLAWNRLVGLLSFELFGHLENVVADRPGFFDRAARASAADVGLSGAAEDSETGAVGAA